MELDNVNTLLSEVEGKSIKATKDHSAVESQLQDVQVYMRDCGIMGFLQVCAHVSLTWLCPCRKCFRRRRGRNWRWTRACGSWRMIRTAWRSSWRRKRRPRGTWRSSWTLCRRRYMSQFSKPGKVYWDVMCHVQMIILLDTAHFGKSKMMWVVW